MVRGQAEACEAKLRGLTVEAKRLAALVDEGNFLRAHTDATLTAKV